MKILVCTDGSKESQRALEEVAKIAGGCSISEVAVIHVFEDKRDWFSLTPDSDYSVSNEDIERFEAIREQQVEKRKDVIENAKKFFAKYDLLW